LRIEEAGRKLKEIPWRRQDCGSGYPKRQCFFPWIRRVGSQLFRSEMNSMFSSFKASVPGYMVLSEKSGVRLEEWILPALGIPIRNPVVANNPSGLESQGNFTIYRERHRKGVPARSGATWQSYKIASLRWQ
jgi:hypothetical protein